MDIATTVTNPRRASNAKLVLYIYMYASIRVTRLGGFSPKERLFTVGSFSKFTIFLAIAIAGKS
jgi:hypothetical protein